MNILEHISNPILAQFKEVTIFCDTHTQTHLHFIITSINIMITIIINLFSDRGALLPGNVEAFLPLHLARHISALLPSNLQPGVVLTFLINEDDDGDAVGDHLVALLPGHLPWDVVALLPLLLTANLDTIVVFNLFEVSVDLRSQPVLAPASLVARRPEKILSWENWRINFCFYCFVAFKTPM